MTQKDGILHLSRLITLHLHQHQQLISLFILQITILFSKQKFLAAILNGKIFGIHLIVNHTRFPLGYIVDVNKIKYVVIE